MGAENNNDIISKQLGLVLGKLEGIEKMMDANHIALHRRLDDMQDNNDRRFDAVEKRVEHIEAEQKNIIWKVASWSSLGGAIVAGSIEAMKHLGK